MAYKREELLKLLVDKAFKYSEEPIFKLASGKMSAYYINCKMITLDPYGLNLIGEAVNDLIEENFKKGEISAVGGLTLGADPISVAASMASYKRGAPLKAFVIRKEPKRHGLKKWLEGNVENGEKVVIIEDVVTTGMSTIKAIKRAKEANLEVKGIIALVDREEGGAKNIKNECGLDVFAIFKKSELLTYQKTH